VRDKLLNRLTKDADIVCVSDALELAKAAKPHIEGELAKILVQRILS